MLRTNGRTYRESQTLDWRPSCDCDAGESVPCLVLDPFCGSGTTLAVAKELGVNAVGLDLSADYMPLAKARIAEAGKPKKKSVRKSPVQNLDSQPSLFGEASA